LRIIGQEQIADVFGVAPKTIVQWQEQGLPVAARGRPGVPSEYDSAACIEWYVRREVAKVSAETPADRLARVKADAIEMDNAERRKLLIPADQLEPKLRAAFVLAREQWMDQPARLARQMDGKSIEERERLLEEAFAAFLGRLASWQTADQVEDGDE
jgi:terminase small subunit / prophage DNA-packing protein